MASWTLVPCLVSLRAEFNELAPGRDKASDGSIGDAAHSASVSDHNPAPDGDVHAIDVDRDLGGPVSMEQCVQAVVLRHRRGLDDRLQNVIYNRRIWSRSWGWTAKAYNGINPHDHHAHFSARYTTAQERDVSPWGVAALKPQPAAAKPAPPVEEFVMDAQTTDQVKQAVREVLGEAHPLPNPMGARLHMPKPEGPGWSPMSDRTVLARLFEMSLMNTQAIAALSASFSAFVEAEELDDGKVREALDMQQRALDELRTVLDAAVEDTSTGEHSARS